MSQLTFETFAATCPSAVVARHPQLMIAGLWDLSVVEPGRRPNILERPACSPHPASAPTDPCTREPCRDDRRHNGSDAPGVSCVREMARRRDRNGKDARPTSQGEDRQDQ